MTESTQQVESETLAQDSGSSPAQAPSESSPPAPDNNTTNGSEEPTSQSETKENKEETPKKDYAPLLVKAQEFKQAGNQLFGESKFSEAIEQYTQAIDVMEGGHSEYPQECSIFYGNRAACYVSLGHHDTVIKDCSSSLALAPSYTKALMRRAVAYEATNQLSKALAGLYYLDPLFIFFVSPCFLLIITLQILNHYIKLILH